MIHILKNIPINEYPKNNIYNKNNNNIEYENKFMIGFKVDK